MIHTTAPLEVVGTLVRTKMTVEGGGFLVAEFRDGHGIPHNEEAKANARLFVAADALLDVAELVLQSASIETSPVLLDAARAAVAKACIEPATHLSICASEDDTMPGFPACDCGATAALAAPANSAEFHSLILMHEDALEQAGSGDLSLHMTRMMLVNAFEAARNDAYAEGRKDEQAELASVLPVTYYMDPPDGGSVTVLEQLQRMAEDARKWRECRESALQEFVVESAQNTRLMDAIAPILEAGHMDQEDLARLRAVYESIIPFDDPILADLKTAEKQLTDSGHDGAHDDAACRALLTIRSAIAKATGIPSPGAAPGGAS